MMVVAPFALLIGSILLAPLYVFFCWDDPDDDDSSNPFAGLEIPAFFSIAKIAYCFKQCCITCWIALPIAIIIGVCIVLPIYLCLFTILGVLLQFTVPVFWYHNIVLIARVMYATFT